MITLTPEALANLIAEAVARGVAVAMANMPSKDEAAERRRAADRARKAAARRVTSAIPLLECPQTSTDIPQMSADFHGNNSPSPPSPPSPLPPTPPFPAPTPAPTPPRNPPLSPKTAEAEPVETKLTPSTEEAIRVGKIMHRNPSTKWTPKEIRAFKARPHPPAEIDALEAYYNRHWPPDSEKNMLRHDLFTLLNNWPGEVERAQRDNQKHQTATTPTVRSWQKYTTNNDQTHES